MSLTKDRLVGMTVYDAEGHNVGTVKDTAFTVGSEALNLVISKDKAKDTTIPWETVQAAGEIIILKKPETQQAQTIPNCPSCSQPLTWIPQYQRWYCYKEKKYA